MSDSIGARLRQARELRHLTIEQASEATKLRTHYLQALESDDYAAIPSTAQARGFLRLYAEFLELDMAELVPPPAPQPAPVVAATPASSASPAAARSSSFLARLLRRFARPSKQDAAADQLLLLSMGAVPAPSQDGSGAVSSEAQTAPHPKPASAKVKKNALSR